MHFEWNSSVKNWEISFLKADAPRKHLCTNESFFETLTVLSKFIFNTHTKAPWSVSVRWILIGCQLKVLKVGRLQSKKRRVCVAAACSSLFSQEGALFIHLRGARWSTAPSLRLSVGLRLQLYVLWPVFVSFLSECFWPSLLVDTSCCHFLQLFRPSLLFNSL